MPCSILGVRLFEQPHLISARTRILDEDEAATRPFEKLRPSNLSLLRELFCSPSCSLAVARSRVVLPFFCMCCSFEFVSAAISSRATPACAAKTVVQCSAKIVLCSCYLFNFIFQMRWVCKPVYLDKHPQPKEFGADMHSFAKPFVRIMPHTHVRIPKMRFCVMLVSNAMCFTHVVLTTCIDHLDVRFWSSPLLSHICGEMP